jgi:LCP family protein required for cell wall assembly
VSKHLNDHLLLEYMENSLSPQRRGQVEAHLHSCPTCRTHLERMTQTASNLTVALQDIGKRTPLRAAHSWEAVNQRRKRKQRPGLLALSRRPYPRYAATLAARVILLIGLVAGIAGLAHTLATTSTDTDEATATPPLAIAVSPSSPPGPLPGHLTGGPPSPVGILVLGVDGENASSSETDLLMFLYLDAEAERAFLLSIPRDLYVEVDGYGQVRAGSVYGIGESDDNADGLTLAGETISDTLSLPVHYTALVRFEGFVTLIDTIGGVDVTVLHAIDDPLFPNGQGGYDPLSIPAGRQHLDGALALRYARTRVVPAEGFDRTFRQRQIVLAAQERVMRLDMLPDLIAQSSAIWTAISESLETNLSLSHAIELAVSMPNISTDDITSVSLDECCTVPHTAPNGEHGSLPQPEAVKALVQNLLEEK